VESFAITIQRKAGTSWPIVVELSGARTPLPIRREGVLELDLEALATQVTPRDYGTMLGQALFRDRIREAFLQARIQSEDRLSVQLFVEVPDLRTLRWERLCAPVDEQWRFLLFDQRTPLTLALPSAADRRFPPMSRADLRALLVVASPQGLQRYRLAPFDAAATVSSVRSALGPIPCDVLSTTSDAVGSPTLDALCERLTSTSYTLLHLICHGRYSSDIGDTVLYLENEEHQVDPVTASRLLDRLSQLRGERGLPHFVFLATCESASPQAEGALGGLAQRLVRELGLPAVLAMTEPVSLHTAEALTGTFYQRLCAHGHLDLALSEACAGLAERPDSTVAALYSRLGARPLFESQVPSSMATSADQQSRTNLLKALGKAYREALESSLQGVASIRLSMRERLDLTPAQESVSWQLPQKERLLPEGTTILDVYDEANTGLLILGNPGAGKSTLLYELAQALVTRAQHDEQHAIPVVLNLSLWATKRLPLEDWIVEQLELRYAIPRKLGRRWQQEERWLLLLDGLDEVALSVRPACVEAINTYLSTRSRLISPVVCSRLQDYDVLREPLRLQSRVVVQPLTSEQVEAYLSTAGPALAAVREVVQRNAVLQELLTTPLMLNVVTLAYKDKASVDLPQLGSVEEQQRQIFASYLHRMLPLEGKRSAPSRRKMQHYLVWLAQQMRARSQSILYLEQLQPDWLPSGWTQRVYTWLGVLLPAIFIGGLVSFVASAFFVLGTGLDLLPTLLIGGVLGDLLSRMPIAHSALTPSRIHPHPLSLLAKSALLGLFVGLGVALLSTSPESGLDPTITGMSVGLGTALLTLLLARWSPSSPKAVSPALTGTGTKRQFWRRVLTNDALRRGLLVGGLFGLSVGLSHGVSNTLSAGLFGRVNNALNFVVSDTLNYGLGCGLAWGLCGICISLLLVHIPTTIAPTEILMWSWKRLRGSLKQREHMSKTLLLAVVIGLTGVLRFELSEGLLGVGLINLLRNSLGVGLGFGLSLAGSYWLLFGLFGGVSSTAFREQQRAIPNQGIRRSGRNGLLLGILGGSIAGVIGGAGILMSFGLALWLSFGVNNGLIDGLNVWRSSGWQIGLAVGLLVTLLMGGIAWWRHWVLRFLLWRSGALPWRLVPLLDAAAQRILLRKVGGGYRFIHDLFRDYLATLDPAELSGVVAQAALHEETMPSSE
jgi:hypothetical protein